jgi:hypothetical protein
VLAVLEAVEQELVTLQMQRLEPLTQAVEAEAVVVRAAVRAAQVALASSSSDGPNVILIAVT